MSRELYPFYERELAFLRQMTREFATRYPATAGRLLLEANTGSDPHVERLLEGFALVGARIQHRLDDEFPELTDGILQQLYPHFMAPVPSVAILQFDHDHARATQGGVFRLQRGTMLRTQPVAGMACRFQTCFPVDLLPLRITEAQCLVPPFPQNIAAPRGTAAVIRIRIEALGNLRLPSLSPDHLRFFINSDSQLAPILHQALVNDSRAMAVVPPGAAKAAPRFVQGPVPLRPSGLEPDEALFPFPASSPQGLRLLTEFFACPAKFHFFRLENPGRLFENCDRAADILVYLDRTSALLEQGIDAGTFRLGCTPVVNLFPKTAEPVVVDRTRSEYLVVPDVAHPEGMEIWSVESVEGTAAKGDSGAEYRPFYSFRKGVGEPDRKALWHFARKPSPKPDDAGTDVHLRLVDLDFRSAISDDKVLVVKTMCTNRQLPEQLKKLGERIRFDLEAAAPV
ncbi:MAG: type VI secretion system baseplate subunit TssF, partial [Planctomycetota bacterium]